MCRSLRFKNIEDKHMIQKELVEVCAKDHEVDIGLGECFWMRHKILDSFIGSLHIIE